MNFLESGSDSANRTNQSMRETFSHTPSTTLRRRHCETDKEWRYVCHFRHCGHFSISAMFLNRDQNVFLWSFDGVGKHRALLFF